MIDCSLIFLSCRQQLFVVVVVDSFVLFLLPFYSYDNDGTSKDEIKERFSQTMEFVENYLRDVVCQSFPFADKEKNKLTFEVSLAYS